MAIDTGKSEREMFTAALSEIGLLGMKPREKRRAHRAWLRAYRSSGVQPYPFLALRVTTFPSDPEERADFLRNAYARSVKEGWVDDDLAQRFRAAIDG